jgi:hypothetical protein
VCYIYVINLLSFILVKMFWMIVLCLKTNSIIACAGFAMWNMYHQWFSTSVILFVSILMFLLWYSEIQWPSLSCVYMLYLKVAVAFYTYESGHWPNMQLMMKNMSGCILYSARLRCSRFFVKYFDRICKVRLIYWNCYKHGSYKQLNYLDALGKDT